MISDKCKQRFGGMTRAGIADQLILMECKRKSDGKIVNVVCGAYQDPNGGDIVTIPYAELIDPAKGDPEDQYCPPGENGTFINADEENKHQFSLRTGK